MGSKDQIENMVKDAEKYAEEDKKRREVMDERNQADRVIQTIFDSLDEYKDALNKDEADALKEDANKLKEEMQASEDMDPEVLREKWSDLQKRNMKMMEGAYKEKMSQNEGNKEESSEESKESKN